MLSCRSVQKLVLILKTNENLKFGDLFVKRSRFDVTTYEGADELWSSVSDLLDSVKHVYFLFLLRFADDVLESAEETTYFDTSPKNQ